MTRREKVLATTMTVVLAVMGGGVLFHLFVYQPISDVREMLANEQKQLNEKQDELNKEEQQIKGILRINPRLSQWDKISLPPNDPEAKKKPGVSPEEKKKKHLSQLQVEYERYLSELLLRNGFRGDSIVITPRPPDRRSSPILKGKEPVYERLTFSVTGQGNLFAVVRTLKEFHTTNLLHQVRGMGLAVAQARGQTPPPAGSLDMTMTVEALLVNGGEERTTLLPAKLSHNPVVLAEPGRSYDLMPRRNMFTGIAPALPPASLAGRIPEDKREVLRFVKLTMLWYNADRRRWEATMYDQAKGGDEKNLNTRILNEIKIYGETDTPLLDAKVVLIDEEQLIFKEDGKFYRMRCGEFLYPVIREPLTTEELKALKLSGK